jgi:hypothetical protein
MKPTSKAWLDRQHKVTRLGEGSRDWLAVVWPKGKMSNGKMSKEKNTERKNIERKNVERKKCRKINIK